MLAQRVVGDAAPPEPRQLSTTGAVEVLAEALIRLLGLHEMAETDEAVEHLPDRDRERVGVARPTLAPAARPSRRAAATQPNPGHGPRLRYWRPVSEPRRAGVRCSRRRAGTYGRSDGERSSPAARHGPQRLPHDVEDVDAAGHAKAARLGVRWSRSSRWWSRSWPWSSRWSSPWWRRRLGHGHGGRGHHDGGAGHHHGGGAHHHGGGGHHGGRLTHRNTLRTVRRASRSS